MAVTPDALSGGGRPRSAPLVDAAVTAALAIHADVRIVPEATAAPGGLGAFLRW